MKRPEVNLETWPDPAALSAVIDKAHELRAQEMKRITLAAISACRSFFKYTAAATGNYLRAAPGRNPA